MDLNDYSGKKVKLVRNLDKPNAKGETAEELEGTVEAVAGDALMFRPKGKTSATIINASEIESIDYAETGVKKLSRRILKAVKHGQARAHLLERHGFTVTQVNEMTEKQALDIHDGIDHEGNDLGHTHKSKDEDESDDNEE